MKKPKARIPCACDRKNPWSIPDRRGAGWIPAGVKRRNTPSVRIGRRLAAVWIGRVKAASVWRVSPHRWSHGAP